MRNDEFISLEHLVSALPGHVYWLDKNNVYHGCNELQAKAFGLASRYEIVGKKNSDLNLDPEIIKIWDKHNLEVLETGTCKVVEEVTVLENAKLAIALSHKHPLFDKNGQIIGLLGISIDVTMKNEYEMKLLQEKENVDMALENIIAHLPGHIYWQDKNNVFLGCNEAQAKSAGLESRHDIVGKTNYDMPWKEQADTLNELNAKVMKTGCEYSVEETAKLFDGQETFFLSKKVPLLNNKKEIVGIMGISFDITERKRFEEELKLAKEAAEMANRAKTEFLENMRHDIRTPVSSMVGFSELLKHEKDDNKIQKYIENLANAAKELLRFLNEVLESINVSSGAIPLSKKKFNLKKVLERVIKLHMPIANEKNLNIEFLYDENIPPYLLGDSGRIYRIVLELLVNALKFTKEGYVKIVTKLAAKKDRDLVIQVEVEDTGPGIPKENQQDLFVKFKRLTASYAGLYKGSGLGLSIAKQFIDDLKGEIYCDDKHQGKGAKFIFVIPLTQSLLENDLGENNYDAISSYSPILDYHVNVKPLPIQPSTCSKSAIRVLIVEDHPLSASAAQELLVNSHCNVAIAISGEMAIKLANENHYDIILMDFGLPDMDGCQITKHIRTNGSNSQTIIIGLTAHADIEKKRQGLDAGMNMVLTKPLLQETVIETFKKLIPHVLLQKPEKPDEINFIPNNYKIVDFELAKKILNNSHEFVLKTLQWFSASLEEENNRLDQAYACQDWQTIQSIAHKLKGGCDYCAALRLKHACNELFSYLESENLELREKLYEQMKKEMQALKMFIESRETATL